jgi:two-component system chemotaxis sensor kinase CheA
MTADSRDVRARLRALFLDELDDHVERLGRGIEALAAAGADSKAQVVQDLFRSAHSLKGAAQATQTTEVALVCHRLEDLLADLRDGGIDVNPDLLAALGGMTDELNEASRSLRAGSAAASDTPPTARTPTAGADARRVTAQTLDDLLARAQQLVVAAHRSTRLAEDVAALNARFTDDEQASLRDEQVLVDALSAVAGEPRIRAALDRIHARSRDAAVELDRLSQLTAGYEQALRSLSDDFADAAWRARAVPFTDATAGLARVVRELCLDAGKQAALRVDAADVVVDRALVGMLDDVLRHLVRNAVDHGIEVPAERAASGKPPVGTITVTAGLRSGGIEIVVADDGRGVDATAVRQAAHRLDTSSDFMELTGERSLVEVLFRPGLSTATGVGTVSGRGVGLDAVRDAVEATGGTVTLHQVSGEGVRVIVNVPLNRSTLRTLLVLVCGELLALPSSAISGLVALPDDAARVASAPVIDVDGDVVPVVRMVDALDWTESAAERTGRRVALVVRVPEGAVAVEVDELVAEREIVMQAPGPRLAGVSTVLGTAALADGSVALVLNPATCARRALAKPPSPGAASPAPPARRTQILLAEDTMTTRELERAILESAGYAVVTAVDGMQAWELLQTQPFDVVVSDVSMPRMDGIALCTTIRESQRWAALPVVLVTSLASEDDRRRGLDAGADAYLTKSGLGRAELLATLERLL